jgi:photosystem II stability/assembly factor-like uncharacterized protein
VKQFTRIILFLVIFNNVCYPQWVSQQSNTGNHLLGICMIDANTGFVAGWLATIRKTTNGGLNWSTITPPVNNDYGGISFINSDTGLAVGPPGLIIQTYNSGNTWTTRNYLGSGLRNVQYVTSNRAYAVGSAGIIRSADGGVSWIRMSTTQVGGLYFITEDIGTVVGPNGLILTTTNGGVNWTQRIMGLTVQFGDSSLYCVKYVNAQTGYACGNNGIIIKTTNGGANWIYIPSNDLSSLYGVSFSDANTGTVVGFARIWRTTNGGNNWFQQPIPPPNTTNPLQGVDFVNSNTGWIVGFNGMILYTSNGGMTWIKPISNEIPSDFKLYQNYPNPFNPTTKIIFSLPENSFASLIVYDMLGREMEILLNEQLGAGTYEAEWNAANEPSGTYFYKLETDNFTQTRKMVLLK